MSRSLAAIFSLLVVAAADGPPLPHAAGAPAGPGPGCGGSFTAARGDTLYSIARRCETSVAELVQENRLGQPPQLAAGQRLGIPGFAAAEPPKPPGGGAATPPGPGAASASADTARSPGATTAAAGAARGRQRLSLPGGRHPLLAGALGADQPDGLARGQSGGRPAGHRRGHGDPAAAGCGAAGADAAARAAGQRAASGARRGSAAATSPAAASPAAPGNLAAAPLHGAACSAAGGRRGG